MKLTDGDRCCPRILVKRYLEAATHGSQAFHKAAAKDRGIAVEIDFQVVASFAVTAILAIPVLKLRQCAVDQVDSNRSFTYRRGHALHIS